MCYNKFEKRKWVKDMSAFTSFLAANYLWFLVISIILLFALIGYFVDQNEQKKGISRLIKEKEPEVNIEDLQALAQNKSLNHAVTDAARNDIPQMANYQNQSLPQMNMPMPNANIITDTTQTQNVNQPQTAQGIQNPIGFDVLTK